VLAFWRSQRAYILEWSARLNWLCQFGSDQPCSAPTSSVQLRSAPTSRFSAILRPVVFWPLARTPFFSDKMQHSWLEIIRRKGFGPGVLGWSGRDETYRDIVDIWRGTGMFAELGNAASFKVMSGADLKEMDSGCGGG
jgi:hypothetical protein